MNQSLTEIEKKLGNRIREARKRSGLTMKQLADAVGVSYLTIHRIENGKVSPSVSLLTEIALSLNEPITKFFEQGKNQLTLIKAENQPLIESQKLLVKLLIPRGMISKGFSLSFGQAKKGEFVGEHITEGHEISYIISGECVFRHAGKEYRMKKGDLVYFDGRLPHSVVALEPLEFLLIYLNEEKRG